jgi:DNA-binding GntR family transcriptional regulator
MTVTRADGAREALVDGFRERLYDLPDRLMQPLLPGEATELGSRAAMAALAPRLWAGVVGDRLTTAELAQLLGVSRQALAKRVASGTLLGMPGKGTTVYPKWQFDSDADRIRVRPEVAAAFAAWVEELGTLTQFLRGRKHLSRS